MRRVMDNYEYKATGIRMCIRLVATLTLLWMFGPTLCSAESPSAREVFEQRLMPIFNSPNPSSCVQCHLASVDLKDYILPSSRDTFISLRDQGLIDVEKPMESKILNLISKGEEDPDAMSRRIHAKIRAAEYEAFSSWIVACCHDNELRQAVAASGADSAGPAASESVIQHTRKDRVLDSFVRNIWSQRMRCFPCHTPAELDRNNPAHAKPIERHREFVKQYGARMNLFKESPEATLRALVVSSQKSHPDRLPLINLQQPLQSLLLLKPTAKLPPKNDQGEIGKPSSEIPVSHMGGIKMHEHDHSYKAFASWLQDYSNSVNENYASGEALPADNWYPTQHVIRIKNLPKDWNAFTTAQIFVYRWNPAAEAWSEEAIAFTQGLVTPRKIINGPLFMIADEANGTSPAADEVRLHPGKVQLRVFLDSDEVIKKQPSILLNDGEADAIVTVDAKFGIGFKQADIVDGNNLELRK